MVQYFFHYTLLSWDGNKFFMPAFRERGDVQASKALKVLFLVVEFCKDAEVVL